MKCAMKFVKRRTTFKEDDVQQVGEKTILESHVPQSIY